MTNTAASTADPADTNRDPAAGGDGREAGSPACAVIVFGRDNGGTGKPHAAVFPADQVAAAERAAGMLGYRVLRLVGDPEKALAKGVAAGRLFAKSGSALVSFTGAATFAALEGAAGSFAPPRPANRPAKPPTSPKGKVPGSEAGDGGATPGTAVGKPASRPRGPSDWAGIEIGSVVLAGLEETPLTWYAATVVGQKGPDFFRCKWLGDENRDEPLFDRLRQHLALLPPALVAKIA